MPKQEKAKIRVFFAEMEGSNAALEEGLRTVATAVQRTFQTQPSVVKLLHVEDDLSEDELLEYVESSEPQHDDDVNGSPKLRQHRAKHSPAKKRDHNSALKMVSDLDLEPKEKPSLQQFFSKKSPDDQQEQVLLIVYYLQHIVEAVPVTVNHVFTCFRTLNNVRLPGNLPQAIRNIANRKGWIDSSDQNNLRVTTLGINHVEHSIGEKATESES